MARYEICIQPGQCLVDVHGVGNSVQGGGEVVLIVIFTSLYVRMQNCPMTKIDQKRRCRSMKRSRCMLVSKELETKKRIPRITMDTTIQLRVRFAFSNP